MSIKVKRTFSDADAWLETSSRTPIAMTQSPCGKQEQADYS
jgi:hypothetical protein